MAYVGIAVLLVLILIIDIARCVFGPIPINGCPRGCVCNDINCVKEKGVMFCREVEVMCEKAHVTHRLDSLPSNATRMSITGENMGHTTLDIFQRFTQLRKLALNDNVIRSLKLSQKFHYLDFLSLDNNRICFLPRKNLTLLRKLNMFRAHGNNLTFIHENLFPPRLTHLDLSHNHIQAPRKGSFRRLRKLRVLKLVNNSISHINPLTFRFTTNLEILDLDHNVISELGPDTFKLLPYVSLLSLRYNFIRDIDRDAFKRMGIRHHMLHQIRLEHNMISVLEPSFIEILLPRRNIYSIFLAGNPLYCNCEIISLRDAARKLLGDVSRATCATPAELEGIPIAELRIRRCDYSDDFYYDYDF